MRELTAHNSKPLIKLWGRSMIDWQLDRLKKGGIREVVVNTAHYADLYPPHFAAHPVEGIKVTISQEGTSISDALETKGGIVKALPLHDALPICLPGKGCRPNQKRRNRRTLSIGAQSFFS
mgnify:CR=1 FL=1